MIIYFIKDMLSTSEQCVCEGEHLISSHLISSDRIFSVSRVEEKKVHRKKETKKKERRKDAFPQRERVEEENKCVSLEAVDSLYQTLAGLQAITS